MNSMEKQHTIGKNSVRKLFEYSETTMFLILVVMIVVFALLRPAFLSGENMFSLFKTLAFYGIVAIGETLVMLAGDIDISVGSTASLGAIVSTYLMTSTQCFGMWGTANEATGVIFCMIIAAAICSVVGIINAFLIVDLKLPGFIATIATLYSVRGVVMVITKGNPIYPLPAFFTDIIGAYEIKLSAAGGISLSFLFFIILAVIGIFLLLKTNFGRNLYATGSNREVAELSGINTRKTRYVSFIITAMLAAFAGMLVAAFTKQGYPPIGQGWEMQIVAATVIGGISLTGGHGSIIGTVIGVFIMNVLNNGLVMLNINTFVQQSILGACILLAVYVDVQRRNKKVRA